MKISKWMINHDFFRVITQWSEEIFQNAWQANSKVWFTPEK